jgi:hypothetical protein
MKLSFMAARIFNIVIRARPRLNRSTLSLDTPSHVIVNIFFQHG